MTILPPLTSLLRGATADKELRVWGLPPEGGGCGGSWPPMSLGTAMFGKMVEKSGVEPCIDREPLGFSNVFPSTRSRQKWKLLAGEQYFSMRSEEVAGARELYVCIYDQSLMIKVIAQTAEIERFRRQRLAPVEENYSWVRQRFQLSGSI